MRLDADFGLRLVGSQGPSRAEISRIAANRLRTSQEPQQARTGYNDAHVTEARGIRGLLAAWEPSPQDPLSWRRAGYTQQDLDEMAGKTVTVDGRELSYFDMAQRQREIERQIRRWKREYTAMEAAGQDTSEAASRLSGWQRVQKSFLEQTGFKRQYEREQVEGFGKSEAAKASARTRLLERIEKDAILKEKSGLPKQVPMPDEILKETVGVDFPNIHGVVPKGAALTNVYVMAGEGSSVPIRDLKRLHETYGGLTGWQKKSGDSIAENYRYVVHWYERNGFMPEDEGKTKGVKKR